MKIAVVGAGVSGLVCALRLGERHDVTLFEATDRSGGHVHTVRVDTPRGVQAIDTGFIVFNRPDYPKFTRLLEELDVPTQHSDMSLGIRCDVSGIEWCGSRSLNRVFGQRRNLLRPGFYRMLAEIMRFARAAPGAQASDYASIGEFLRKERFNGNFRERYLLPMGAALWSCSEAEFAEFPVRFVVEFLDRHHLLDPLGTRPAWRCIQGGSQRYVEALIARFRGRLRLATPIKRVSRNRDSVMLTTREETFRHDEVVLACHADEALAMLADATPEEASTLSAFPYTDNAAMLHTDTRVLARNPRCRGAWNVHRSADTPDKVAVTYDMNVLQNIDSSETFCVSLNESGIAPQSVIKRMHYRHPRFTLARTAAQSRRANLLRVNRTSYCGAYWGFGFHEDGVASAEAVAAAFGCAR